jgi:hypothetical protein
MKTVAGTMAVALALLVGACSTPKPPSPFEKDFDDEEKPWVEVQSQLPPMPEERDLLDFDVSGATQYRFSIDTYTLSIGTDDVFRFVLVATSPSGARNVSYEGIRCETGEKKIYATGRSDRTWVRSRNATWTKIEEVGNNRQHAALEKEYFCPEGYRARSVNQVIARLKPHLPPSEATFDDQTKGINR